MQRHVKVLQLVLVLLLPLFGTTNTSEWRWKRHFSILAWAQSERTKLAICNCFWLFNRLWREKRATKFSFYFACFLCSSDDVENFFSFLTHNRIFTHEMVRDGEKKKSEKFDECVSFTCECLCLCEMEINTLNDGKRGERRNGNLIKWKCVWHAMFKKETEKIIKF